MANCRTYVESWQLIIHTCPGLTSDAGTCSVLPSVPELLYYQNYIQGSHMGAQHCFHNMIFFSSSHYIIPSHPVRQGKYVVDPISQIILIGGVQEKEFSWLLSPPYGIFFPWRWGERNWPSGRNMVLQNRMECMEKHVVVGQLNTLKASPFN